LGEHRVSIGDKLKFKLYLGLITDDCIKMCGHLPVPTTPTRKAPQKSLAKLQSWSGHCTGAPILFGRYPSLSVHESESMLRTYLVCREKQANGTWEKHTV
jgi:hypothetical protein